jgi:hypothetical protein
MPTNNLDISGNVVIGNFSDSKRVPKNKNKKNTTLLEQFPI